MRTERHDDVAARRAAPEDLELITSIVTRAFEHDPLWSQAMRGPGEETEYRSQLWRIFVEAALRHRWTWITAGAEAVAVWVPPDCTEMTEEQEARLDRLAHRHLGAGAADFADLLQRLETAHPHDQPHYYLSLLATHPAHRGQGLGMGLLAHNLALIDAEGLPAYLESSNPANDTRYARLGFQPVGAVSFPGGGPIATTMWRSGHSGKADR